MALNHPRTRPKAGREQESGLTLIEVLVTLVVLFVLLALAVPSFKSFFERNRLAGAAQTLYADLQFARAESIKRNVSVQVFFDVTDSALWCYGIDDDLTSDCDCSSPPGSTDCTVNGSEYVALSSTFPGVLMTKTGSDAENIGINPTRGTIGPARTVFFDAPDGKQLSVKFNTLGRVKLCVSSGSVMGFASCSS